MSSVEVKISPDFVTEEEESMIMRIHDHLGFRSVYFNARKVDPHRGMMGYMHTYLLPLIDRIESMGYPRPNNALMKRYDGTGMHQHYDKYNYQMSLWASISCGSPVEIFDDDGIFQVPQRGILTATGDLTKWHHGVGKSEGKRIAVIFTNIDRSIEKSE